MTLASELVWELVPPLVLASDDFVLSALLEPCYDIGGDAFDYALDGGVLHFAVFDAMGHGLLAAGMASRALSAYRHSRRNGDGPAAAYVAIDAALAGQEALTSRFVTALIAELDLATGALRWVSAGHPAPLLLRDGRFVKTLDVAPSPPLALALAVGAPAEGRESLEPGDMVLLYTDGLTEARRPGGELFTRRAAGRVHRARGGERASRPGDAAAAARGDHRARGRRPERRRHRRAGRMAARHRAFPAARHRLSRLRRSSAAAESLEPARPRRVPSNRLPTRLHDATNQRAALPDPSTTSRTSSMPVSSSIADTAAAGCSMTSRAPDARACASAAASACRGKPGNASCMRQKPRATHSPRNA